MERKKGQKDRMLWGKTRGWKVSTQQSICDTLITRRFLYVAFHKASFTTVSRSTHYPPRCRTELSQTRPGRIGSGPALSGPLHPVRRLSAEETPWSTRGLSPRWPPGRSRCCRTWRTASACSPASPAPGGAVSARRAAGSCTAGRKQRAGIISGQPWLRVSVRISEEAQTSDSTLLNSSNLRTSRPSFSNQGGTCTLTQVDSWLKYLL